MTEDKTVGWHHQLNGHEFKTPGVGSEEPAPAGEQRRLRGPGPQLSELRCEAAAGHIFWPPPEFVVIIAAAATASAAISSSSSPRAAAASSSSSWAGSIPSPLPPPPGLGPRCLGVSSPRGAAPAAAAAASSFILWQHRRHRHQDAQPSGLPGSQSRRELAHSLRTAADRPARRLAFTSTVHRKTC